MRFHFLRRTMSCRSAAAAAVTLLVVGAVSALSTAASPPVADSAATVVDQRVSAETPTTSTTHPYSMPIWFPIRDETYLDCVLTNYGCGRTHTHWSMDMVLETLHGGATRNPGVYAMGAGIMHIQVAHGHACGHGAADFGTTAWIDHGGGLVSRYGHLKTVLYRDGTRLAAGQKFAIMGTTGKGDNCAVPYLDFQIRSHGITGPTKRFDTLQVCSSGAAADTWPTDLDATNHIRPAPLYASRVRRTNTSFNQIPKRTIDFPASNSSCIPSTVPGTPNVPAGVRVTPTGRGRLTVSWNRAPSRPRTTSVQVQLSEYHPSTHTWDHPQNEKYRSVSPAISHFAFTGLTSGHSYRATVVFRNSVGYGRAARTLAVTSVAAPATPGARRAYVTETGRTASLHFSWVRPKEYGLLIRAFEVQVRRLYPHRASGWSTTRLSRAHVSWYRPGLSKHATYQVRVRATYDGGHTGYLTRTLRT